MKEVGGRTGTCCPNWDSNSGPKRRHDISKGVGREQTRRRRGTRLSPRSRCADRQAQRTVRRATNAVKTIGIELAERLPEALQKPAEMKALAAMPAAERSDLIDRAVKGEKVSARGGGSQ